MSLTDKKLKTINSIFALRMNGTVLSITTDSIKGKLQFDPINNTAQTGYWQVDKAKVEKNVSHIVLRAKQEEGGYLVYTGVYDGLHKVKNKKGYLLQIRDVALAGRSLVGPSVFNDKSNQGGFTYVECSGLEQQDPLPEMHVVESLPEWREGEMRSVTTRPDQSRFSKAVRENCKHRCVVTGVDLPCMTEAAHLTPHKEKGIPDKKNGLLLRRDLHALFDYFEFSINPADLTLHFTEEARKCLGSVIKTDQKIEPHQLNEPIDAKHLHAHWAIFKKLHPEAA